MFKDLDACVSPVLTLDEAPLHKHNKERNSFRKLPDNTYIPYMNWLSQNEERSFELPKIGQHSQQVLKEIGFSNSELDELISENVIDDFNNSAKL